MNHFIITQLFMGVLSMSLTASLIGLIIAAIRPFTEKYFSKKWNYYIWLLVIVRLAVPLHFETDLLHMLNLRANIGQTQPAAHTLSDSAVPDNSNTMSDISQKTDAAAPDHLGTITNISTGPNVSASDDSNTISDISAQLSTAVTDNSNTISGISAQSAAPTPIKGSTKQAGEKSSPVFSATSFLTVAAYLWLFGAIAALFIKLWSYHRFQSAIRKERVRITDYRILSMESAFCTKLGIYELPVLYESSLVSGPLTVGLQNPVIVFPLNMVCGHSDATENNRQNLTQLQLMLHHELLHVARKDLLYKWVCQFLLCIHWFNPLLRWFGRQINRDCELSCDEAILAQLTNAGKQMYGNILLDTAARNIDNINNAFSTTLLENKKNLKKRLDSIRNHSKKTRFQLVFSICTLMALLPLSACSSVWITMNDRNTPEEQQINTNKYGDAWKVYDDDTLIAEKEDCCDIWNAYNYCGGQNITASKMRLYGSSTVVIAYADKDIEVDVASSFEIVEGKFKIVFVAPDGTVNIINDTGTESRQTITMKEGRNAIKLVGQGARIKKLALDYSDMNIPEFKNVYFSEDEEYAAQLDDKAKAGEAIEKEKVMNALYMIQDKKEVSDVFHTMLISRVSFTTEELCDIFICSDAELSSKYLTEAIADGYQKPLDTESISELMLYIDEKYRVQLLMQLPAESFYEALKDNVFNLDSEQIEECLASYIQNGGRLSYDDFSEISFYLDENAIKRINAMLSESSTAKSDRNSLLSQIPYPAEADDMLVSWGKSTTPSDAGWKIYNDNLLIAGDDYPENWSAWSYGNGDPAYGKRIEASAMILYGSLSIVIAYAEQDVETDITSAFETFEGKFKIVHIAPDGSVTTINDSGAESKQTITMKKGRNVIKLAGQGAKIKKFAIVMTGLKNPDFEKIYYSAEEEETAQVMDSLKTGAPIDKDKAVRNLSKLSDNRTDISEIFHSLLISRTAFTADDFHYFFMYSDRDLSGKYLVEAVENGYQSPPDTESASIILPYIDKQFKVRLFKQLPPETFYATFKESLPYLDESQIQECLTDYIQKGGTLTDADFSKISHYLDKNAIEKLKNYS